MAKNSKATLKSRNVLRSRWKETTDPRTVQPYTIGKCNSCGKIKRKRWATTFTQTGKPEYRPRCKDCNREFTRNQSNRNRESISKNAKARKSARKSECISYLGGKCYRCAYKKSTHALTFHHKSRAEKDGDISSMLDYSWLRLRRELDRCVLVCFNCHMELEEEFRRGHHERQRNPRAGN